MAKSRWIRRIGWAAFLGIFAVSAVFGFGITPGDWSRMLAFETAAHRWQSNPDFRAVTFEYADLGSRAMQTKWCGVRAKTAIMWFRKIPGLPADIAVNPTSQSHYDDFSAGPWAAYFHLLGEQDLPTGISMIQKLGSDPTDERIRQMLSGFKLPVPTATDVGAVISVRSLIDDVKPDQPFAVQSKLFGPEKTHEADGSSNEQQMMMLRMLDKELHGKDLERWRTKQVNDFLSGIWAQGYGLMYADAIRVVGVARVTGRILAVALLIGGICSLSLRERAGVRARANSEPSGVPTPPHPNPLPKGEGTRPSDSIA